MMLLDLICVPCISEQIEKGIENADQNEPILVPLERVNDSGIYEVTCHKGHKSKIIIDNLSFEILFDYAINALADGYTKEAVASFTSALERFYEFFIKTSMVINGVNVQTIDESWKLMSNQSERQLGAFIALHLIIFDKKPNLLNPNKEVKLRNDVIHKGYIPKPEEALNYGNNVLDLIESTLIELKNEHPNEVELAFEYYSYKNQKNNEADGCVNIMTTIDVMHGRELDPKDHRNGDIARQLIRVVESRNPRKIRLIRDLSKKVE